MIRAALRDSADPAAQPETGIAFQIRDVAKAYGQATVLHRLSLDIPKAEFVAVVGRSGGGKTTLLRLLAGLERPDQGTISFNGAAVTGPSPALRVMFQDARLLPWERVIGNVGIARQAGWREAALASLAEVGLAEKAEAWPRSLSGGQRQRVALARALVAQPQALLLDEPFGALDALTRLEMQRLLAGLCARRGITAVLITHDVAEAVALADRVLVLLQGRVALDLPIDLPRPRRLGDPAAAALEQQVLDLLMQTTL